MEIRAADLEAVTGLWRELAGFPASRPGEALDHCMRRLAEIIGACNVSWMAAVRDPGADPADPLRGWRGADIAVLHDAETYLQRHQATLEHFETELVDPQSAAMVARAGSVRALLRASLVEDTAWERSWLYQEILRPVGIEDRLVGSYPVGPGAESYFALDRDPNGPPFGRRARDVLRLFLAGCPTFHEAQLRVRGLLDAADRLSPRETDVLKLLLTGRSEREMADALGLSYHTAHQYVISVYRKFDVNSRAELTARWLGQEPEPPTD